MGTVTRIELVFGARTHISGVAILVLWVKRYLMHSCFTVGLCILLVSVSKKNKERGENEFKCNYRNIQSMIVFNCTVCMHYSMYIRHQHKVSKHVHYKINEPQLPYMYVCTSL